MFHDYFICVRLAINNNKIDLGKAMGITGYAEIRMTFN